MYQFFGRKELLRPNVTLMAENYLTAVITVSAVLWHFIANSYGFGVSAKNPFRSHTTKNRNLNLNDDVCFPSTPRPTQELWRRPIRHFARLELGDRRRRMTFLKRRRRRRFWAKQKATFASGFILLSVIKYRLHSSRL